MQKMIKQKCFNWPVNNGDMVPQTFFDVFPMELKTCTGKLLAAATVHFYEKVIHMYLSHQRIFL